MTRRQTEHPTQSVAPGGPATQPGAKPDPTLVDPVKAMMAGRNAATKDDHGAPDREPGQTRGD